jgi:tRNA pseudouridine38-40 synthase
MSQSRIALKIAYIGTGYHGFQYQPGVETVEGELRRALKKLRLIRDAKIGMCCRTDSGVSALSQVVAFDTALPERALPRAINSYLPGDVWVLASASAGAAFNPRIDALSRTYRYLLYDEGYDMKAMRGASKNFIGTHDFSNLSLVKNVSRTVEKVKLKKSAGFVVLDFTAKSFAQGMVRRMVSALCAVGLHQKSEGWLIRLLDAKCREGVESAPADGLVLLDVRYKNLRWKKDEYAERRARDELKEQLSCMATKARIIGEILNDI